MQKNKKIFILIVIINIVTTIISYISLIYGKFESNYGYEYLGIAIAILTLIISKHYDDLIEIYDKVKTISIIFIIANAIPDAIFTINSIIRYPYFFWWQNFM